MNNQNHFIVNGFEMDALGDGVGGVLIEGFKKAINERRVI